MAFQDRNPSVSVILPVRNEAHWIGACLQHIRMTSTLSKAEIIVVDGQSSDRTRELAAQYADRVLDSPLIGRAVQMDLGVQYASGDLLVFLHADTVLPPDWQACVRRAFVQTTAPPAFAAFQVAYDSDRLIYRGIAALANLRAKLTGIPHGNQGLVVARSLYLMAGGFPPVPLMEEYLLISQLKRFGRTEIFKERVVTSCRRYEQTGPLRNLIKNASLTVLFYLGISPRRLARWYW